MRAVDRVDDDAGGARRGDEGGAFRLVLERRDREGRAIEVLGAPGALADCDRARGRLGRRAPHVVGWLRREHLDGGAGGGEELRLPGRAGVAAGDDRPLAGKAQEHGQCRERREAGLGLNRLAGRVHGR